MGRYERAEAALGKPTDASNANTAYGKEKKAKEDRDSKLDEYNTAKATREAATEDERNAFLDLVIAKGVVTDIAEGDTVDQKREKAKKYLDVDLNTRKW